MLIWIPKITYTKLQHEPWKQTGITNRILFRSLVRQQKQSTAYRVEEYGEEQLSSIDEFVQLLGASRVLVVENGVCEETARLPGQHLRSG